MSLMNNKKSLIAATLTSALVFAMFGSVALKTPQKHLPGNAGFQYVVAKTPIKKGDVIKEEDVEIKNVGVSLEGAYKATGEVVGRTANVDITQGKPVIKGFVKKIEVKAAPKQGIEPAPGFRAVPMLVKKSSLPPYVSTNSKFDLFTRENSIKIENLKILNMTDPPSGGANKMLILEISNKDVPVFLNCLTKTKGFFFLQKNPEEYGDYKFYNLSGVNIAHNYSSNSSGGSLPSIERVRKNEIPDIDEYQTRSDKKQVEIIVGSRKSKMEF